MVVSTRLVGRCTIRALLALNVGAVAALSFGLAIMLGVATAAHLVSRTEAGWSAPL